MEAMPSVNSELNVSVYTYSGEVYRITGYVEESMPPTEGSDAVIELRGTFEEQELHEESAGIEEKFPDASPLSLTLYTPSGEIYGFQSFHEVFWQQEEELNNMEMYGYIVGFYDGERYYS
ncbi:MAG: hypothetical protein PHC41_12790 [Lachnospiraceae bacterium]|nr:hypothetical protein [Lachnospiraceae bacterium]MDD3617083.1 hypothetical protein [Lachnospiraceae bacterium]